MGDAERLDKIHVYVYRERADFSDDLVWRVSDHQPEQMLHDVCELSAWVREDTIASHPDVKRLDSEITEFEGWFREYTKDLNDGDYCEEADSRMNDLISALQQLTGDTQ